ncbi:MAG: DUF4124 domain-containing protein [Nevskiaceae bacterium]|nr:MAG: DUF4124 domain-containing protein [Nevskiaceae bacterium]
MNEKIQHSTQALPRSRNDGQHRRSSVWAGALVVLCLATPAVNAQAAVYRWVDTRGQVHYSQTPPAKGEYRLLDNPAPMVFTPDRKAMSDFLQATEQRETAVQQGREQVAKKRLADAGRCAEASKRLEDLESRPPRRFFVTGPDGQPSRMTDEQWETRKGEAQAIITQSCR